MRDKIKQKLEGKGMDFKSFLEDCKTLNPNKLSKEYGLPYNWVVYFKGMNGYPINLSGKFQSKYDISVNKGYVFTLPKVWKVNDFGAEDFRDVVYKELVKKGLIQKSDGVRE